MTCVYLYFIWFNQQCISHFYIFVHEIPDFSSKDFSPKEFLPKDFLPNGIFAERKPENFFLKIVIFQP